MINSKIYLNVPYAEKDAAKTLGAKWDPTKKKWYAPANTDISLFSEWQTESSPVRSKVKKTQLGNSVDNLMPGVTTYPIDKEFIAYSGKLPPWD